MPNQAEDDAPARLFPGLGGLFSNFIIAVSILPLGLFVFSLLGRYFYYAELVCNFRCQIMFLLVPCACFSLGARRWWLSGILLAAIGWSMIGVVWVFIPGIQPPAGSQKLKVMSYNVLHNNSDHARVVDQIRESDPDFITILEYVVDWHRTLDCLNERYPYQVRIPRPHGFGVAMFSKYPISDTRVRQLTKSETDNPFVITHVNFGEQTIRLAAVHTLSPINRLRMKLRNQQLVEVAEELSKTDFPTVVMGDFNCVPWSTYLVQFAETTGYRESRQGFGYQATFPADQWMIRIPIDHAYVSPDVHVHSRVVGKRSKSDHLPILFEVSTAAN